MIDAAPTPDHHDPANGGNSAAAHFNGAAPSCGPAGLSTNGKLALHYVKHSLAVFPCGPNKKPLGGILWSKESTCDPATIARWWRQWPDALVGLDCGKAGVVVVDADRKPGAPDGVAALKAIVGDDLLALKCPINETAGNGLHLIFGQSGEGDLFTNRTGALPKAIDVRGVGGHIVAPGSTRPDGAGWRPMEGSLDLCDAWNKWAIPQLPSKIADMIRSTPERADSLEWEAAASQPLPISRAAPSKGEIACAAKALADNTAELAAAGKGRRNTKLNRLARRMGRMAVVGWINAEQVRAALRAACEANGYIKDKGQRAFSLTFTSGFVSGAKNPHPPLVDRERPIDAEALAFGEALAERLESGPQAGPQAKAANWPEPKPIESQLPAVKKLTPDMLPEALRDYVFDVADRQQSPGDFVAVTAMCGPAALAGNTVRIKPKRNDDWVITPNIRGAIIGRPSAMKSPAMKAALAVVYAMQDDMREEWEATNRDTRIDTALANLDAKDAGARASKALKGGNRNEARRLLEEHAKEITNEPPCPRLVVNDATVEKLG